MSVNIQHVLRVRGADTDLAVLIDDHPIEHAGAIQECREHQITGPVGRVRRLGADDRLPHDPARSAGGAEANAHTVSGGQRCLVPQIQRCGQPPGGVPHHLQALGGIAGTDSDIAALDGHPGDAVGGEQQGVVGVGEHPAVHVPGISERESAGVQVYRGSAGLSPDHTGDHQPGRGSGDTADADGTMLIHIN